MHANIFSLDAKPLTANSMKHIIGNYAPMCTDTRVKNELSDIIVYQIQLVPFNCINFVIFYITYSEGFFYQNIPLSLCSVLFVSILCIYAFIVIN